MTKEILEYIKILSLSDKKNISQKALKVSEECGELAKVILPYDNADGTTHRFIVKNKILEETIDIMLSAISIAYELGYSNEDINDMMLHKAEKWQSIQAKSEKVNYPIPYEIHVTVKLINNNNSQIQMFKNVCGILGVKPIVLDLENGGEVVMKDVMTSSNHIGNNTTAYEECERISNVLLKNGFNVIRSKIETVPWHPAAPTVDGDKMPKNCYFEAHVGCIINLDEKEILNNIAKNHNAHLSRNFFKKLEDGKNINMITLRYYEGTYNNFMNELEKLKDSLKLNNIEYEKVITEFSIYDTKVSHDYLWIEKK